MLTSINTEIEIGNKYNFSMRASSILGTSYDNAKVLAKLVYSIANTLMPIDALHASILPSLPTGTPVNPKDLNYIYIETNTGEKRIIAEVWVSSPPTLVTNKTITVTIGNMDLSKVELLRTILISSGFTEININTM